MATDLVIVESPTKARTVGRFLGRNFVVKASMGHVRDLPASKLGVDVDEEFKPTYQVLSDKRKIIKEVKEASKDAEAIYLATDPDREGEAISWHLLEAAGFKGRRVRRVVFHEITSDAIKEAFAHPRELNMDLVNAQQARRVLDRLLGYQLSPLLWSKVGSGLSAGRVQSAALRLVVERAREIQNFVPREYWSIEAALEKLQAKKGDSPFTAALHSLKGDRKKLNIASEEQATGILQDLEGAAYTVSSVRKRDVRSWPAAPFTTSTLQQEAGRKLRFPVKKTMFLAQQLYEGISLGNEGEVGLITYMRTDSTNLASSAVQEARSYIKEKFGEAYLPKSGRTYTTRSKNAQEAHEAIRPTAMGREPDGIRGYLSSDQYRLYDLIWKRMIACQMADAVSESTSVDIDAAAPSKQAYLFRATGSVLKFPGYRAVYVESRDNAGEEDENQSALPELAQNDSLKCNKLTPEQHFTQPPGYYTEASLVKALEEQGIGRPSTYAPTVSTIQEREYVRKDDNRLMPTKLGEIVNDLLVENFSNLVNLNFTAQLEEELDEVAQGHRKWSGVLKEFYEPFHKALEAAQNIPRVSIPSDEVCDKCGRPMEVKTGRYGRFLSCTGYPECKNSRPYVVKTGVACPECGGDLVERRSRKRNSVFYGCSNYPRCTFAVGQRPLSQPCPVCGKLLVASGKTRARCTACDYKGTLQELEEMEQEQAEQQEPVKVGAS